MDVEHLAQKILSEVFTRENIHDSDVAKVFKHVEPIVSTAMNMADALQFYFNNDIMFSTRKINRLWL